MKRSQLRIGRSNDDGDTFRRRAVQERKTILLHYFRGGYQAGCATAAAANIEIEDDHHVSSAYEEQAAR